MTHRKIQFLNRTNHQHLRITTTLEKYLQTNSEGLNSEVYINPLRHINDMVTQNEEMERIRQK